MPKLRGVAVFDAALCIVFSFLMVNVGPTTDYGTARSLVAIYAGIGGALVPGCAILISFTHTPRLAWCVVYAYVLLCLHAGAFLMQALGNALYESIGDNSGAYGGSNSTCLPKLDSPMGMLLGALATIPQGDPFTGDATLAFPCMVIHPEPWYGPGCSRIGLNVVGLAFAMGLWTTSALTFRICWKVKARVQPEEVPAGRSGSKGTRRKRKRSRARRLCLATLVMSGAALVVLAYLVFWACPADEPYLTAPVNISSSTTNTTTTTVLTTSSTTTTTTTTTTSSNESNVSFNESNVTNATNETNGSHFVESCAEDMPPLVLPWTGPPPPLPGCRCGDAGARSYWAWTAVPAEQIARTFCGFGDWASAAFGFFMYCCHSFACSLTFLQARLYSDREMDKVHAQKLAKIRLKARTQGRIEEEKEDKIVLWQEAERDAYPTPEFEVGSGERYFNV